MLSLCNVTAEMAGSYFEKDDYYSSENGPGKAEFFGKAVAELGVSSEFKHEIFENLLHGFSPDGKHQLIQMKPLSLSEKELMKISENFSKRVEKIGLVEDTTAYIRDAVIEKAKENQRHFSREESRFLRAEVGKYISILSIDSEEKKNLKKATLQLIKNLSKSTHRAALDCTFSAPKSVSIACLVGGKSELLDAHRTAVNEAVKFIEDRLSGTRIGAKESRQFARTGNVVGAKFHHGTSREGDPQLHTHCVIMNLTQRDKNNWRAMHTDPIYQHSKLAGVLYQNKLAELVQKIGYEIDVKTNGTFEIKGYTEQQLSTFSKRRQQVMENSAKALFEDMKHNNLVKSDEDFAKLKPSLLAQVNQKMNRASVLKNRHVKSEIKAENLKSRWQKEANESEIKHPEGVVKKSLFGSKLDPDFAREHLTERKSVIKKLDLIVQNLSRNLGRATSREIAKAGFQDLDLLTSKKEQSALASLNHAAKEDRIIKMATQGMGKFETLVRDKSDDSKQQSILTNDQKSALKVSYLSKDQLLIWNGVAGSGKTWVLKELREKTAKNGYKVFALAPDASSASILGNQLGVSSSTVHSFLKNHKCTGKALLIVDEAGKFSTKLMHDLLKKVEGTQTRIILSGDYRQLGAVEAGNPYRALLSSGVAVVNLNESVRQKNKELKANIDAISSQRSSAIRWAVNELSDKITERKSLSARVNSVVKAYEKLTPEERKNTLILADTNYERALLTSQLREKKKVLGELSTKEVDLKILVPRDMTEAQRRSSEYFRKGDILVSNMSSAQLHPGTQYIVEGLERGKVLVKDGLKKISFNPSSENISVYQQQTIKIAEKDKLEWRRNHAGHENREEVTVKSFVGHEAVLEKKSGDLVRVNLDKPQFIDYAHVSTTYSSQGKTSDKVIALTQATTSRESFYVAVSRARQDIQIVTDNKEKLMQRALKSSAKENALDHLEGLKFNLKPDLKHSQDLRYSE